MPATVLFYGMVCTPFTCGAAAYGKDGRLRMGLSCIRIMTTNPDADFGGCAVSLHILPGTMMKRSHTVRSCYDSRLLQGGYTLIISASIKGLVHLLPILVRFG